MRTAICLVFLLFSSCAYAMTQEDICRGINRLSTDCRALPPTIEDMKVELEYLQIQHQLEQARKGIFSEPIVVPQPQGVKITTYFEEE